MAAPAMGAEKPKIYKNKDVDQEILYSPQIKIAKELKTCFIAYVRSGFSFNLYQAGFRLEYLYDDIEARKYYLVYCPSPSDVNALNDYGNARIIEENVALFWCDNKEAREILPARFGRKIRTMMIRVRFGWRVW